MADPVLWSGATLAVTLPLGRNKKMRMANATDAAYIESLFVHFAVTAVVHQSVCVMCQKTVAYAATAEQLRIAESAHTANCEVLHCPDCVEQ
jgi:hypothetical protein